MTEQESEQPMEDAAAEGAAEEAPRYNDGGFASEAARHVLWHNGDPRGIEPGSFMRKLIDAWASADVVNSHRLGMVFPHLAIAVHISQAEGSDALAKWAGIE